VKTFKLTEITCGGCGAAQKASKPARSCPACGKETFRVEVERSAWGIEPKAVIGSMGTVGAFIDEASDDDGSLFCRTHSLLRCGSVSGTEIATFMKASLEERKRFYIGWKRREVEATLGPDHAICDRCGVAYKIYTNAWNRAGLCSRPCHQAYRKSQSQ
jgi:hypothetical protein